MLFYPGTCLQSVPLERWYAWNGLERLDIDYQHFSYFKNRSMEHLYR